MNVAIDCKTCGDCHLCVDACPDVFCISDGKTALRVEMVPSTSYADCRYASAICPKKAIKLGDVGVSYDFT